MFKVKDMRFDEPENIGCNNGVYGNGEIIFEERVNGKVNSIPVSVTTCKCHHGCNGTNRIPEIGMTFDSLLDFWDYTER